MVIYFVSVASVIAAGVATYFATTLKKERDDLKVKFEQAKDYADSVAKTNITLKSNVHTLTTTLQTAERNLQTAERQLVDLKSVVDSHALNAKQPVTEVKQSITSAPAMTAKKAGRGRPSKKVVA